MLTHHEAEVVSECRVRIINGLILTHHAAQLRGQRPRSCLKRRIGQDFAGGDRPGTLCYQAEEELEQDAPENHHFTPPAAILRESLWRTQPCCGQALQSE